jgi:hypothetical protein
VDKLDFNSYQIRNQDLHRAHAYAKIWRRHIRIICARKLTGQEYRVQAGYLRTEQYITGISEVFQKLVNKWRIL